MTATFLTNVRYIKIGVTSSNFSLWYGIRNMSFESVEPWVNTDIPGGMMLHQQLKSPHVEGEIVFPTYSDAYTYLYNTVVDSSSHKAIEVDGDNYSTYYEVGYFVAEAVLDDGATLKAYEFSGLRFGQIFTRNLMVGREAEYVVKFHADVVSYPT